MLEKPLHQESSCYRWVVVGLQLVGPQRGRLSGKLRCQAPAYLYNAQRTQVTRAICLPLQPQVTLFHSQAVESTPEDYLLELADWAYRKLAYLNSKEAAAFAEPKGRVPGDSPWHELDGEAAGGIAQSGALRGAALGPWDCSRTLIHICMVYHWTSS